MANSSSNIVTPGLVSTNPFLFNSPSTGGATTSAFSPTTGSIAPAQASNNYTQNPQVATTTGFTGTASGGIVPTNASTPKSSGLVSLAPTSSPNSSTNSAVGVAAGKSAPPPGYMYNASGQLVNASGQPYVAPTSPATPTSPVATNTGTPTPTPGYVPVPQVNAPGNPNTATGSTFNNDVGTESQIAANQSPEYQAAITDYNTQKKALADLQTQAGQQNVNILGSRTNLAEAGGEQGLLSSLEAQEAAPLTQEMQADAALLGAATNQQSTQQAGLQGAAGLVSPQAANPYGTYSPATGQYNQYGGATGGGAAAAGGVQGQIQQGTAVQNMTGIYQQAQGLASTLTSAINSSGYNPAQGVGAATTYANGINQWLQSNSGNPEYQNVANLVSEVANKYAAILNQSGGTPTSVSQVQQQIINGLASGQDIEKVLGSLAANAQTSIQALQGASGTNSANGTQSNTKTNVSGGTNPPGTVSAGGYNFVKNAQGQWVAQ